MDKVTPEVLLRPISVGKAWWGLNSLSRPVIEKYCAPSEGLGEVSGMVRSL